MTQKERRKHARKDVLDTFHVFIAIPKKGSRKIYLKDVSEGGVGLQADPEDDFKSGETFKCEFYINPSLKLPLELKVCRVDPGKVGCELASTAGNAYKAYVAFISLLDQLAEFVD
ncbi:MAG: PilZ domain-containing protein [Deltaproteobacteria bacterium]|nr:PilZ domain-containing protein [Deltaproteobacteria bacterium]